MRKIVLVVIALTLITAPVFAQSRGALTNVWAS